ncbi:MAG: cytochrome ubiquinol oxidase subunit I [Beijerinckiaceae bacterium]|nr:cytochrome ubiquinol oxidase subunit I [Beijerinckiaceae bacterium]
MTGDLDVVQLSRLQFGLTAMYHFLFVPLTIGLAMLLGIMESVYVMTGREVWRQATKFWGALFGINFAMGVATGITMEFQFGMNWAYYSHYAGDIFGAPLAIEGLMAFFLEATFIGLFFFGWDRMPAVAHLGVTWLVAIGSNLSALWILIANGWMQHPVGARFNPDTMRMEVADFAAIIFNETAQEKFVHTVSAGYVTGAMFVASVSAIYILLGKHIEIARRSMRVALSFGLASALSVAVLGDASGYTATENQKMKVAAIEAMWETEPPPAAFTVFGLPNQEQRRTDFALRVPWVLGLLTTHSIYAEVPGIDELVKRHEDHIWSGLLAYSALQTLRADRNDLNARAQLAEFAGKLGYALLLKKIRPDIENATGAEIKQAAWDTVPDVAPLFWAFRIMVGLGFFFIFLFGLAFYLNARRRLMKARILLWVLALSLPLPWIAAEAGWFVAEVGRQPWAIEGVLPTFLAVSSVSTSNVLVTLFGFIGFYSALLIVDVYLMIKAIRLGPEDIAARPRSRTIPAASSAE